MMNMRLTLTLEAFNQKHGEFYLQLQSLAKQYNITIEDGNTTPTVSAPTVAPKTEEKKTYVSNITLTLDDNGYIHLPLKKTFVLIKAGKVLASKGLVRLDKEQGYGWYIPNAEGTIDVEATKAVYDSFENHTFTC